MKTRSISYRLLGLVFVLSVTISALFGDGNDQGKKNDQDNNRNAPLSVRPSVFSV
jgi:hypothetical protein